MATAADSDQDPVLAGELYGVNHVSRPCTPHDDRGTALMHRVEDGIFVVSVISGPKHISADRRAELLNRGIINSHVSPTNGYNSRRHDRPPPGSLPNCPNMQP